MSAETDRAIERAIIEHYGIDAPGSSHCPHCEVSHRSYIECPPVLPLGTETWAGIS